MTRTHDEQAGPGQAIVFWLWMTVTAGGLAVMLVIVIAGR